MSKKLVLMVVLVMAMSVALQAETLHFAPVVDSNWSTVGNWFIGDPGDGTPYGNVPQPGDDAFLYGTDPGASDDPVLIELGTTATLGQIWFGGEMIAGVREGASMVVEGNLVITGNFIPGCWNDSPSYNTCLIKSTGSLSSGDTVFTTNPNNDAEYVFTQEAGSSMMLNNISFWGALLNFQCDGYLNFAGGFGAGDNQLLINLGPNGELVIGSDSFADILGNGCMQALGVPAPTADSFNVEDLGNGYLSVTVPEPMTMTLLGLGGLALIRRKR